MKRNERGLPYLDRDLVVMLFAGASTAIPVATGDQELDDLVETLHALQRYNIRYRADQCLALASLFRPPDGKLAESWADRLPWLALALSIQELYGMRRSTLGSLLNSLPPQRSEDDILVAWALCFDGYAYRKACPFDEVAALERFWKTGQWAIPPLQQLTLFFVLQRLLYKWGGEQLPRQSKEWRAFRSLFLETYACDVPEAYRLADHYDTWRTRFHPYAVLYYAEVSRIHAETDYGGTKDGAAQLG